MAAAVTLAERGAPVTVFESGPVPGGRARRVHAQGHDLDNGQHILIGAYAELLRLMRLVGVPSDAVLRIPLELRYADGFVLRSLWLPSPLGMLGGLLAARRVPFAERIGAVRFMLALKRAGYRLEADIPVATMLETHEQAGRIGHYLWRPLCIAALNTPPEQASAQVFVNILRDSLAGESDASDLLLPRVDLSRLFPDYAADFVQGHGGEVRIGSSVRTITPGLQVDGESFSSVILAVGPHQLKPFAPLAGEIPEYAWQPIYTCTLQYADHVKLPFPMLGFADGMVQWALDHGALLGARGRIACVISAQGDHQQMTHDEIAATCHRELARALGALPEPLWSQVIAEKRATFACVPGVKRPGPETPTPGLFLAGDYTDPEYPATLEAAVRSGVRAARCVLNRPISTPRAAARA